jgi:signal transduction histidine kinase
MSVAFGLFWLSLIPFGYVVITVFNYVHLAQTKNFVVARGVQITISIVLPFLFQIVLGGLPASGATMLWSMLCLSAIQSFGDRASSIRWLLVFFALTGVAFYVEWHTPPPIDMITNDIMRKIPLMLFMLNFLAVSSALFVLISFFMHLQRQMAAELVQRNREIADSQRALIQSEKMAALGRLSAGMAHELNNPAAAAARGAKHLRQSLRESWQTALELGEIRLTQEQAALLADLHRRVEAQLTDPPSREALERIDLEQQIEDWCDEVGLARAPDAGLMLESGLTPEVLETLQAAFLADMLPTVLRLITSLYEREALAEQVTQGTERISLLVQTLKAYTYMDRAETQPIDVNTGLLDTLIMLQGELKHGINVQRLLDPALPCILANGGELNQVWTNLVSNAAEAMEGHGTLKVSSHLDGQEIVVRVIDSGPGIPPEVRDTLFDPFVTTKPVGKGTGLGLNISRNIIVDKHGGRITVDSKPGRTCFEVRLPVHEAACPEGARGRAPETPGAM